MTAAETYALAPTDAGSQRTVAAFARARAEGRTAVIPFVTAGYPTPQASEDIALAIVRGGADLLEIGVPFSDPLADGATVQRTSQVALSHGITLRKSLEMARRLRDQGVEIPLILMGYVNPMLAYGIEKLAADSAAHGVDGFIVPDLPAEEAGEIASALRRHGVDLIFLVAPTSTEERIAEVGRVGSGWVYCVSTTGVTGERTSLPDLKPYIDRVRSHTSLPIAVGFGVSNPDHIAQIGQLADGAVIASAMINFLDTAPIDEQAQVAERYVRGLRGEEEFPPVVSASEHVPSASASSQTTPLTAASAPVTIACRGVRGATTIETNTAEDILEATTDLLEALIRLNDIQPEDVVSAVFTTTPELTAAFPALAARKLGWTEVPLLCAHEMAVPGALEGVIRILLHINSPRSAAEIRHIYLREARALRPEWALTDAELADTLGRPVPA
ncbi:MAG: tryptophan synthase subunit alpha [Thermomicrobiales bacterium]